MPENTPSHYFDPDPTSPQRRRWLNVRLAGREVTLASAGGVFSADRLDPGTAVLLREVPDPPGTGTFLDLGCGWGPLALTLGLLSPHAQVIAVDINARSRELTGENAASLDLEHIRVCAPEEVEPTQTFQVIWSNPPIRIGKPALHDLLRTWLPRLTEGGDAYLVVAKNLGADSLQTWLRDTLGACWQVSRHASAKGYRVLRVHHTIQLTPESA